MATVTYTASYGHQTKRERYESLRQQLANERASFEAHWEDLANFILPRRLRFQVTDTNRGERKNRNIYDATATMAARTLRSGMMSGVTSPARPWFRLVTPDPDLNEFGRVKTWLEDTTRRMRGVFDRTNLYTTLPLIYGDIGTFGTAAMIQEESFEKVTRFRAFPLGSYYLAADFEGKVNTFIRKFRITVRNLVEEYVTRTKSGGYDWSNVSRHVKNAWDNGNYNHWVDVVHVIAPNPEWNPQRPLSKYKRFASCTYEAACDDEDKFLRESGYDTFPILAPRWETSAEDVYGTDCPGMVALGDVRQLQLGERKSLQAIEKMVNPPMQGPSSLRNAKASILPGDITYYDTPAGREGLRPIHEVNPKIQELEAKQAQVRDRIRQAFFEDLFLALTRSDRREITAREIEERHEEKLLALGPVLEQLNTDLLDPLIDNTFAFMLRQGVIPPPPEELRGMELRVDYISIMAQAQKLVAIGGLERLSSFVGSLAAMSPTILDKVDTDQLIDEYSDALGVPAKVIRTDEQVAEIRQSRAQAEQARAQAEMVAQGAKAARDLSAANLEGDNALARMMDYAEAGAPLGVN